LLYIVQNILGSYHEIPEKKKFSLLEQDTFGIDGAHPAFGYNGDLLLSPLPQKYLTPSNQNLAKGLSPFYDYQKIEQPFYFKPHPAYHRPQEYETPNNHMNYFVI
jgi:hypothetical protein